MIKKNLPCIYLFILNSSCSQDLNLDKMRTEPVNESIKKKASNIYGLKKNQTKNQTKNHNTDYIKRKSFKSCEKIFYEEGSDEENYDEENYDEESYDEENYDEESYDEENYDEEIYDEESYDEENYDEESYDEENYDEEIKLPNSKYDSKYKVEKTKEPERISIVFDKEGKSKIINSREKFNTEEQRIKLSYCSFNSTKAIKFIILEEKCLDSKKEFRVSIDKLFIIQPSNNENNENNEVNKKLYQFATTSNLNLSNNVSNKKGRPPKKISNPIKTFLCKEFGMNQEALKNFSTFLSRKKYCLFPYSDSENEKGFSIVKEKLETFSESKIDYIENLSKQVCHILKLKFEEYNDDIRLLLSQNKKNTFLVKKAAKISSKKGFEDFRKTCLMILELQNEKYKWVLKNSFLVCESKGFEDFLNVYTFIFTIFEKYINIDKNLHEDLKNMLEDLSKKNLESLENVPFQNLNKKNIKTKVEKAALASCKKGFKYFKKQILSIFDENKD